MQAQCRREISRAAKELSTMHQSILLSLMIAASSLALSGSLRAEGAAGLPPGEKEAKATIEKSPRHGEWVDRTVPGAKAPLRSYMVYPERQDQAPVAILL